MQYVILSPDTTQVLLMFGAPQPITADKPGYAEIADDDPRIAAFNVPPKPTRLNPGDFLLRFTPTEQAAVQQAAISNAQIALGLTMGLARGIIDLNGPLLLPWMEALVAAGCITQDRLTQIMAP